MSSVIHAPATTARLTAALAAAPEHLRPILLAVRDHRVGLLFVAQGAESFAIPSKSKRPAIVVIGDDMHRSVGLDGFHTPSVRRAIRACRAFAVVTSVPTADLYASMCATAVGGRHAMIIETRLEHEFQWIALIQKLAPRCPLILATVKGGHA